MLLDQLVPIKQLSGGDSRAQGGRDGKRGQWAAPQGPVPHTASPSSPLCLGIAGHLMEGQTQPSTEMQKWRVHCWRAGRRASAPLFGFNKRILLPVKGWQRGGSDVFPMPIFLKQHCVSIATVCVSVRACMSLPHHDACCNTALTPCCVHLVIWTSSNYCVLRRVLLSGLCISSFNPNKPMG